MVNNLIVGGVIYLVLGIGALFLVDILTERAITRAIREELRDPFPSPYGASLGLGCGLLLLAWVLWPIGAPLLWFALRLGDWFDQLF